MYRAIAGRGAYFCNRRTSLLTCGLNAEPAIAAHEQRVLPYRFPPAEETHRTRFFMPCGGPQPSMTTGVETPKPVLRKTALNATHRAMGAKMVDFGGWDMPVEYPTFDGRGCGLINEHMAVRTGVGLFDVSHMGDLRIRGPQ